ncbi:MAG: lytic transglycosylase domain-containing protein [Treponema sp.]|jgi:soluble lytic murein transglycosylase|nr:lytic transglycosylase domain-containing protein [Treponema sp.]
MSSAGAGRPGFFLVPLLFLLHFNSCAAQQVQPDFYQGLLARAGSADKDSAARQTAVLFFEKALNSPNIHIRQAAAEELLLLFYEGTELAEATLNQACREAAGSWAAAFEALDAAPDQAREKVLAFILSSGNYGSVTAGSGGRFPDEAALYVLRECLNRSEDFFSASEEAAIKGHIAASQSRFSEALAFFRAVPDEDHRIFLQYPDLLNDLGRSYQYAAIGIEGIALFLDWEKNRAEARNPEIRFRLLFFAARIARQRGLVDQGIGLFVRALPFAPNAVQADACIWYILDSALGGGPGDAIGYLSTFVRQWHDDAYFSDVLDKLSRELILRRQWSDLIQVFTLIRNHPAGAVKYAYIIGRAIEEGYLSPEETRLAAEALMETSRAGTPASLAGAYLRIAHEAGTALSYYRVQSAAVLGEPFPELPKIPAAGKSAGTGAAMEFLLGFFRNGAGAFAPRYIRTLEKELSTGDLRRLAGALEEAGLYAESIRLVSLYITQKDYKPDRRDLELLYPRPFKGLVEQYAAETGVAMELLFGLIRTESAFQSGIVSQAGAIGLTQLMPATARETADRIRRDGGPDYTRTDGAGNSGLNLLDPAVNIHIGAAYLAYLMKRVPTPGSAGVSLSGEDPLLALLAYNGGMNRVRRWRSAGAWIGSLPPDLFLETVEFPETREYGRRVLAAAALYRDLYKD